MAFYVSKLHCSVNKKILSVLFNHGVHRYHHPRAFTTTYGLQSHNIHSLSVSQTPFSNFTITSRNMHSDVIHGDKPNPECDPWSLHRKVITTSSIPWSRRRRKTASFDVGYIDTGANWSEAEKECRSTVVALHGSPATHADVIPVVAPFYDRGCRIIAVNLPGYEFSTGVTKRDYTIFSQSTSRIAEFVLDFLSCIEVKNVNMLVGHSGGALPATLMAGLSDIVRSVMFICSPPGHKRLPSMRPMWGIRLLGKAYRYTFGRMILRPLLPIVNRMTVGLQSDRPSHIMSTVRYISNIEYALLREIAEHLHLKKVPTVYVCSENDSLVDFCLSLEWAVMLGVTRQLYDEYDCDFEIKKMAVSNLEKDDGYKKGVIFSRGGHFPQLRTDTTLPILIREAEKLLDIVMQEQKRLNDEY